MKRVLLAGASGMVGGHVLELCLESTEISEVILLNRRTLNLSHPKIKEFIVEDFDHLESEQSIFQNIDLAFFCVGVYTGSVSKEVLEKVTVDYAVNFAQAIKDNSPGSTFCFLSGAGADRTEKSRMPFARFKGKAENIIDNMGFTAWYSFRPGYIYPVVPRKEPSFTYRLSRFLYPLIKLIGKNMSVPSTDLAAAMLAVGLEGHPMKILENADIVDQYEALK